MSIRHALVFIAIMLLTSAASAGSVWQRVNPATDAVGEADIWGDTTVEKLEPGETVRTTLVAGDAGATEPLNVSGCSGWSVDAKRLASAATVLRCDSFVDTMCIAALTANLTTLQYGYFFTSATQVVKITGASSTDIISITCGG